MQKEIKILEIKMINERIRAGGERVKTGDFYHSGVGKHNF